MGFFETVTPAEAEAGRMLGLATMLVLIFVGFVPPLRPYAYRIRLAAAGAYIFGVLGFAVYFVAFR
jgi:hypothetical protein